MDNQQQQQIVKTVNDFETLKLSLEACNYFLSCETYLLLLEDLF